MLLLSAECPKSPGKREISDMDEDLVNHSKDQLHYLMHWVDISQNSEKDKARIHQFGKKLSQWFLLVMLYSRERNLEEECSNYWRWRNGEFGVIEIYFRRLGANEVLITQLDEEFVFPAADGSEKLSGRTFEFQEPTLRRDYTVRRKNLSGESRGDRGSVSTWRNKRWRRNQ